MTTTNVMASGSKHRITTLCRVLLLCALLAMSASLSGVAQQDPLPEFEHTAWTQQNGAPSQILTMAQTTDGYLWLGTANGLFRFDGVSFEAYQPPRGQQFPHTSIQSLAATADGGLWIGFTLGDTSFLRDGVLTTQLFRHHLHHASGTVYSIVVRQDGSTWAATINGPIHLVDREWQDAKEIENSGVKSSYSLFEDPHRTLWMVTDDFAYRLPYGASQFEKTAYNTGSNATFAQGPDGAVWIADQYGLHDIEAHYDPGGHPDALVPFKGPINDLRFDDQGALWAIADQSGIALIAKPTITAKLPVATRQTNFQYFTAKDGLTSERGFAGLKDHEGNIWVATSGGLDRFRRTALTRAPLPSKFAFYGVAAEADGSLLVGTETDGLQKLQSGQVSKVLTGKQSRLPTLYRAPDGKLWLGGLGDLGYLANGRYTPVPVPAGVQSPPRDTQAITSGPGGDLWMQTASRLGILRLHDGHWNELPGTASRGAAVVMTTDTAGRVWAGYMDGFLTIFDGDKRTTLGKEQGLTVGNVLSLFPSGQYMWVGGEHGLNVMREQHLVTLSFAGDTRIEGISGILRTADGTLWLNSLTGILAVPPAEVELALRDATHGMHYRLFNYLDGLLGKAPQLRPMPSIIQGIGTRLWFTTTNGVVSLDTAHIFSNPIVPPVSIRQVWADGVALDTASAVSLPKGSKDIQIDYTALSLSIPERVRFRYKLEGYDKEWQDAGSRRQAFYTHLPPGRYTFHVLGCNNDGLWNETGASIQLYLPPSFFQSLLFKALLVIAFLAALCLMLLFFARQETARIQTRLEARFSERERIARELHDTLFQSVEGSLLSLNAITSRLNTEQQVKSQMQSAYQEVDRVLGEARNLIFDLRQPMDAQDLGSTIQRFADEVRGLSDVNVEVHVQGTLKELRPAVYNDTLKIVKECIWNAFRHAQPKLIKVSIGYSRRVFEVSVTDDGVGIAPSILEQGGRDGHWGLPGMRERVSAMKGTLSIRRRDIGGTEIRLSIGSAEAYEPKRFWRSLPWLR